MLTGIIPVVIIKLRRKKMPAKNSIKRYVENGYYHVYNRGVDKRIIFLDDLDYRVFLHLLKFYLSPQNFTFQNQHPLTEVTGIIPVKLHLFQTLPNEVNLLAYCLMPNHFHLLLKQITPDGVTKLLRRVSITYAMYFNKRHKRVGHLFQGIFKAVLIENDAYLLHLSRYIHLNPTEATGIIPVAYPYSSYQYYMGTKNASWIKPKFILDYFQSNINSPFLPKQINTYKRFVEDYIHDSSDYLGTLTLETPEIEEE